ncbi:MAG: hypothetical protein Q8R02_04855 [Hyphomonadaceae bacterium]|nr:hypothetical protein [Hyphomonadaceae bacterium]
MSNPSKDPDFNAALQKMLKAEPKQNKDLKLGPKRQPKPKKEPKRWPWERG